MKTPTQSERADFEGFCRQATLKQLMDIYEKEKTAGRGVYAAIAREERIRRMEGRE